MLSSESYHKAYLKKYHNNDSIYGWPGGWNNGYNSIKSAAKKMYSYGKKDEFLNHKNNIINLKNILFAILILFTPIFFTFVIDLSIFPKKNLSENIASNQNNHSAEDLDSFMFDDIMYENILKKNLADSDDQKSTIVSLSQEHSFNDKFNNQLFEEETTLDQRLEKNFRYMKL